MNNRYIKILLFTLAIKTIKKITNKNHKGKKKNSLNLPSFIGVIEVKHSLKGRVRLYVPLLKQDTDASHYLLEQLKRIREITYVQINNLTGSLTIKYDDTKIDALLLIGIVAKILKLETEMTKEKKSLVTREFGNIKEVLNMSIYNKTKGFLDIKSLYIILFIILGIKGIRTMPRTLPNGYTMLRWAYATV